MRAKAPKSEAIILSSADILNQNGRAAFRKQEMKK
jgi:hypothetical protein